MLALDLFLFNLIHDWSGTYWLLDWLAIFLAKYSGYLMAIAALFLFLMMSSAWKKQAYYFAVVALSFLLSYGVISSFFHYFYHRPRPFAVFGFAPLIPESGYSFPSNHAVFFFSLALVTFFFSKKLGGWFLAGAVLMGIARVYVGVHYPFDIVGGAVIGIFSVLFVIYLLEPKKFRERISRSQFML